MRIIQNLFFLLLIVMSSPASASKEGISVNHSDNTFKMMMRVESSLPLERVFQCLTDFDNLHRIHNSIDKSQRISRDQSSDTVMTVTRICVSLWCKSLKKIEKVTYKAPRMIQTVIEPQGSDFTAGKSRWMLMPTAKGGTTVEFYAMVTPEKSIAPFVGPLLIKRILRQELTAVAENLRGNACLQGQ